MIEGTIVFNRARNERMVNAGSRWYILPRRLRTTLQLNQRVRFNVVQLNPEGDRSGYASAIDIECEGWPIINPNDPNAILQAAINLTEREERRYQGRYYHRQINTGSPISVTRPSPGDVRSTAYIASNHTVKRVSEWPQAPLISRQNFYGVQDIAQALIRRYSPVSHAYIMLGNSPAPIAEFLVRKEGVVCLSLPLSNVQLALADLGDPGRRNRMWAFLGLYVAVDMLQGRTSVVVVDISGAGNALVGAQSILDRYYINHLHAGITVRSVMLNPKDRVAMLDTGEDELQPFGLIGLPSSSNDMASAQKGILNKTFKEDYGYGIWNRTQMNSVFEEDDIGAGFDRDRYLTMMIDLLRAHGLKYYGLGD